MAETFRFQAEIKQLLYTLVHSLYTDREIFLRELLSNSSDALHRIKFEMLTNRDVVDPDAELGIWISTDEDVGTVTVSDSGIGMTQADLVENLGTISKSGIKAFLEQMSSADTNDVATDLIGQFGVGFYSIFMVADKVEVITKSYLPDEPAYRWVSEGDETFTIEPSDKATRGTDVILYLNPDGHEFASLSRLRQVVRKHSNYIPFPIYLVESDAEVEPDEDVDEKQPEPVNEQQAIWRRMPSEVEEKEYHDFYKSMTLDFKDPLLYTHVRSDAPVQFYALLYIPSDVERPVFSPRQEPGLQLFARKVLIQDYSTDLLPEYLQFVHGVVDSEDLPLNVSRETVQANRVMVNLKKAVTGRVLREINQLADKDVEKYTEFWTQFGPFIKHGVVTDFENKERLVDLLRFHSTHSEDALMSLQDYVERMKDVEGQEAIYYVIADNVATASRSPHLEPFRERGIEVLYFTDTVDSFLINSLLEYKEHPLHNVDDEDLDLSSVGTVPEDTEQLEDMPDADQLETIINRFENVLGERVASVRVSKVLTGKSPARLVSPEGTLDRHTQRVYKMLNQEYQVPQKILEINPHHALTHNLLSLMQADRDEALIDLVIEQIYENALLLDGLHPNPADMVDRIQKLLETATER